MLADTLIVIGMATASLGTIQEADGPVERTFWLRNSSREAVVLTQGYTSCGCTTLSFPKDSLIHSGDSAAVTLRFNPRGKGGDFEETATLTYKIGNRKSVNSKSVNRLRLSLEGSCITSEETLLRQFPIKVSDSLRLSANRFDLGVLHVGDTRERNIAVLQIENSKSVNSKSVKSFPITFTVSPDMPKGLQHIPYPLKIDGKDVVITLDVIIK